jgi:uncharacterized membrane protein YobD (UPF0266 family)
VIAVVKLKQEILGVLAILVVFIKTKKIFFRDKVVIFAILVIFFRYNRHLQVLAVLEVLATQAITPFFALKFD